MRSEIKSENLILRRYEINFAPLLYEAAIESRGGEFSRWMPWCHENYTLEESETFIAASIENWKDRAEYDFAIFDAQNGKFAGGVSLNLFNRERGSANLGYWVRTNRQNRGFAHTAARLLAKTGFEDLNLNRIEIAVAVENYASQKTAEKSGATREGILRKLLSIGGVQHDAAMFSFVREDFNL
ncbi:MAG TPA: GNAT family protein [Pyrinomonadaceae bacterium]|jgi:ribosomal-protein-serine acetyltransferase